MCKFSSKPSLQKHIKNVFAKIVQSAFILFKDFQRAIKCRNPVTLSS